MNRNNNPLLALILTMFVFVTGAFAQESPEYATTAFDKIQLLFDDGALLFGVVVALAIVIMGFWKGRAWFKRV